MTAVNDLDLAVGKQAVFSRRTGTSFLKPGWIACDFVPHAEVSVQIYRIDDCQWRIAFGRTSPTEHDDCKTKNCNPISSTWTPF